MQPSQNPMLLFQGVLVALIGGAFADSPSEARTMVYVSLQGEDRIAVFQLNEAGDLTPTSSHPVRGGPGALTASRDARYLFASMRSLGRLASFAIDRRTGFLQPRGSVPAGDDPAFLSLDQTQQYLLTAYYVAAKVTVHRVDASGRIGASPWQSVPTADKAHAIVTERSNQLVHVPHTGPNRIFQFLFDARTGMLTPNSRPFVEAEAGQEPRHLVWHPHLDLALVSNERGSSLSSYRLNRQDGTLQAQETWPTLPADFSGQNSCAKLTITPDGRSVFVSNRGHDSLASFQIDPHTGKVTPVGIFPTEPTPRGFDIDPLGQFLVAAGQSSGNLAVYRILSPGRLERVGTRAVGLRPWWVLCVRLGE